MSLSQATAFTTFQFLTNLPRIFPHHAQQSRGVDKILNAPKLDPPWWERSRSRGLSPQDVLARRSRLVGPVVLPHICAAAAHKLLMYSNFALRRNFRTIMIYDTKLSTNPSRFPVAAMFHTLTRGPRVCVWIVVCGWLQDWLWKDVGLGFKARRQDNAIKVGMFAYLAREKQLD